MVHSIHFRIGSKLEPKSFCLSRRALCHVTLLFDIGLFDKHMMGSPIKQSPNVDSELLSFAQILRQFSENRQLMTYPLETRTYKFHQHSRFSCHQI